MSEAEPNRELTAAERHLVRWMLEHGTAEACQFLPQLEVARVTPWRCPCGCASINFAIEGHPEPTGGMHVLADFIVGSETDLSGVFVYEQGGVLSGLEVSGYAYDAPTQLPHPEALRPFAQ